MIRTAVVCLILAVAVASGARLAAKSPARPAAPDPLIREARSAVAELLKDPAAAQFRGERVRDVTDKRGRPLRVVCGEVNAKNAYGGYAGFAPYLFWSADRSAYVLSARRDVATAAMLADYCP